MPVNPAPTPGYEASTLVVSLCQAVIAATRGSSLAVPRWSAQVPTFVHRSWWASETLARSLQSVQDNGGEGPSRLALESRLPVLIADLTNA